MIRQTHTVAELELSSPAYDEIARKLRDAGYDHCFGIGNDAGLIDMTGIGVTRLPQEPMSAETVLAAAVAMFEADFDRVVIGRAEAFAETGEPYTVIASGGRKPEGELTQFYKTEVLAIGHWLKGARAFAAGSGATLYWRTKPELGCEGNLFSVYSRFLVSDKPIMQPAGGGAIDTDPARADALANDRKDVGA